MGGVAVAWNLPCLWFSDSWATRELLWRRPRGFWSAKAASLQELRLENFASGFELVGWWWGSSTEAMAASVGGSFPSALGFVKEELAMDVWSDDHNCESVNLARPAEVDKDFMCPICFQTMKDAFLTSCGHSFCYSCITTHLSNRSNCPSCAQYLTADQLIPNFLLTKVSEFCTLRALFKPLRSFKAEPACTAPRMDLRML